MLNVITWSLIDLYFGYMRKRKEMTNSGCRTVKDMNDKVCIKLLEAVFIRIYI